MLLECRRGIRQRFTYDSRGKFHGCRKYNTYQLRTLISKPRHINFYQLLVQTYTFDPETHKITMVLEYELYNYMFESARIGHENTYDSRAKLPITDQFRPIFSIFCFQVWLNAEPWDLGSRMPRTGFVLWGGFARVRAVGFWVFILCRYSIDIFFVIYLRVFW